MNAEELKAMKVDDLIAMNQALGREADEIAARRRQIADLIRAKLTVEARIADLEAQLAALKGNAPGDAVAPGAVVSAAGEG